MNIGGFIISSTDIGSVKVVVACVVIMILLKMLPKKFTHLELGWDKFKGNAPSHIESNMVPRPVDTGTLAITNPADAKARKALERKLAEEKLVHAQMEKNRELQKKRSLQLNRQKLSETVQDKFR